MTTKKKAKQLVYAETTYIFSDGPFPNLENTFADALVTTHKVPKNGKSKNAVVAMLSHLAALRDRTFYTDYAIINLASDEALTMAGLSAPQGCYIARVRCASDFEDLSCIYIALMDLIDSNFIGQSKWTFNLPFNSIAKIASINPTVTPLIAANVKLYEELAVNQAIALALAWDTLDKQFKVNK
jgi:hypothetical protein